MKARDKLTKKRIERKRIIIILLRMKILSFKLKKEKGREKRIKAKVN